MFSTVQLFRGIKDCCTCCWSSYPVTKRKPSSYGLNLVCWWIARIKGSIRSMILCLLDVVKAAFRSSRMMLHCPLKTQTTLSVSQTNLPANWTHFTYRPKVPYRFTLLLIKRLLHEKGLYIIVYKSTFLDIRAVWNLYTIYRTERPINFN